MKRMLIVLLSLLLTATAWAQNNALDFDGTDDYVSVPANASLNMGGSSFTIETWVKSSSTHTSEKVLIEYGTWQTGNYQLTSVNHNRIKVNFYGRSSAEGAEAFFDWTDGQWHHIAGVFDNSANRLRLFIDGKLVEYVTENNSPGNVNRPLFIGSRGGTQGFSEILMDEIRIWNTARTGAEIRQNMYKELVGNEANLVAYYNFNETSVTTADDGTSNNNDGTLTNMDNSDWVVSSAMFGPKNCLEFDGSDDYVNCGNILSNSYTKEAWVFVESWHLNNNFVSGGTTSGQHALLASSTYDYKLSAGHNNVWNSVQDNVALALNTWYHICVTYDEATTTMTLYKNGNLVSTNNSVASFTDGNIVFLSSFDDEVNHTNFNGKMDEVRIWNTARTATEIRENMCKTLTGNEANLVAYYNFDNTSGTTLQDFSGNEYDGTLQNMTNDDWVSSSAFNTWLHTISTAMGTASNWSRTSVPTSSDNVGIYNYTGIGTLSGNISANNLVVGSGITNQLNNTITVDGNIANLASLTNGTIVVSGSGTQYSLGTPTYNSLTIDNGSTLELTASANLKGNYSNSGAITDGGNYYSLTFNGSSTQSVAGAIQDITLSNNVQLSGNASVSRSIIYSGGNLNLNSYQLTVGTEANLGGNTANRIYGVGSIYTQESFVNPNLTDINGIGFGVSDADNTLNNLTINRYHTAQGSQGIERYFVVSADAAPTNATITLHYNEAELNGIAEADLKIFKSSDNGNTWIEQGTSAVDTDNNRITLSGINSFSWWTAGETGADQSLPVTLTSFTGKATKAGVLLEWETSAEIENAGFVIRRQEAGDRNQEEENSPRPPLRGGVESEADHSANSPSLEGAGGVLLASYLTDNALVGQGSVTKSTKYTFTDTKVEPGKSYTYTLSDVDFSGKETKLDEIKIKVEAEGAITAEEYTLRPVYPNPFNAVFTVPFSLNEAMNVKVSLYNIAGQQVMTILNNEFSAGDYHFAVNADELSSGVYFVKTDFSGTSAPLSDRKSHTQKIVLMK
jgi:hypothetical protein